MTPPDDDVDLPPEQDAVRRLLAEARYDEPVPAAVAARLDAVLAELAAERAPVAAPQQPRAHAPVVDLAARRRRSVATALLAAAAVVVAGVGVTQVVDLGGGMGDAGAGSDAGGSSFGSGAESEADGDAGALAEEPAPSSREGAAVEAAAPAVSSDSLRRDLREAMRVAADLAGAPQRDVTCPVTLDALDDGGTAVRVVLDDRPAVAVYAVPQGARQQVDVYLCGTDVPAESVSLRVR